MIIFLSATIKKGTLAFAEENWNPEGNEQAM